MDTDKFVVLKANVRMQEYVSVADIKMKYSVDDKEAQEMLDKLIQGGLVDPFSFDGLHFKVRR